MPDGRTPHAEPPLVAAALVSAAAHGFAHSCSPEVGRLLRVLAASVRRGTIAEIGSGCGVGAAWICSSLGPRTAFVTVEADADRAAATRTVLAGVPNASVITGDWRAILAHRPFALAFVDVADAKHAVDAIVDALEPGGVALLDDLTPFDHWPEAWRGRPDPIREAWLHHPDLTATEILVTPASAAIIAVRRDTGGYSCG
jgi:predicted O-methyltransferase YrrM